MSEGIPQREALRLQLAMIAGNEPAGGLLEVRHKHPGRPGMGQQFFDRRDREAAAEAITALAARTETYVGAAPRRHRHGGTEAIARCWTLWADCDGPAAVEALDAFHPPPAVVVATGSGGNRHAYWPLRRPLSPEDAQRANRQLAHALGADVRATDAARILRPAASRNFKHDPPAEVRCTRLEVVSYIAREVVDGLPDPPEQRGDRSTDCPQSDDPLRGIPATLYVPALTGRELGREGKVRCPFHAAGQERTPSLHVYPGDGGWYCYGCERGGGIIDLGARLYGIEPRGAGFHEIRGRLASDLLRAAA